MGLPLQSVMLTDTDMYHEPLRLSVVIQSPLSKVSDIIERNVKLKELLDNQWIYLMVIDPKDNNRISYYNKNLNWSRKTLDKGTRTVLAQEKKRSAKSIVI